MIDAFNGPYYFLSNFYPGDNTSAEHMYQAGKARTPEDAKFIMDQPTPQLAKKAGRRIDVRYDWEEVKLQVMESTLRHKFFHSLGASFLREKLLETGEEELVEGNWWGIPIGVFARE